MDAVEESKEPLTVISFRRFVAGHYMDIAFDAEDALASHGDVRIVTPDYHRREYWLRRNRIARYLRGNLNGWSPDVFAGLGNNLFFFLMWCDKRTFATMRSPRKRKWVYIFDCWEPHWEALSKEMRAWRNVGAMYLASSQAAEYFESKVPFPVRWCPQASTPIGNKEYDCRRPRENCSDRKTVLNIGRVNATLSRFFEAFCRRYGMEFITQASLEDILFKDRDAFLQVLRESDIVVVHPRNIDNPEITGCVSMLTARYFEAYQSGGVVCGFKPTSGEFQKVLGDIPFVEYVNDKQFEDDLLNALSRPDEWHTAKVRVETKHSWVVRTRDILTDMEALSN